MATSAAVQEVRATNGGAGGAFGKGSRGDGEGSWKIPERVYVTGLFVALCGIGMFFTGLVSAYVVREGLGQHDAAALRLPPVLWLNTVILLASSEALVWARARQKTGDASGFKHWWRVAMVLGLLFCAGQLIAWEQMARAGYYLSTSASAGFFYVFTAAHAVHLLGGLAILLVLAVRTPRRMSLASATQLASLYWHFLGGLWVLLLLFLAVQR